MGHVRACRRYDLLQVPDVDVARYQFRWAYQGGRCRARAQARAPTPQCPHAVKLAWRSPTAMGRDEPARPQAEKGLTISQSRTSAGRRPAASRSTNAPHFGKRPTQRHRQGGAPGVAYPKGGRATVYATYAGAGGSPSAGSLDSLFACIRTELCHQDITGDSRIHVPQYHQERLRRSAPFRRPRTGTPTW